MTCRCQHRVFLISGYQHPFYCDMAHRVEGLVQKKKIGPFNFVFFSAICGWLNRSNGLGFPPLTWHVRWPCLETIGTLVRGYSIGTLVYNYSKESYVLCLSFHNN